jgi:hypothetical protein
MSIEQNKMALTRPLLSLLVFKIFLTFILTNKTSERTYAHSVCLFFALFLVFPPCLSNLRFCIFYRGKDESAPTVSLRQLVGECMHASRSRIQ